MRYFGATKNTLTDIAGGDLDGPELTDDELDTLTEACDIVERVEEDIFPIEGDDDE